MTSSGRRRVSPRSGTSSPRSTRTSVVLPAPLGPITVTISPAERSMSTPCRTARPARASHSPRALTRASASWAEEVAAGCAWWCPAASMRRLRLVARAAGTQSPHLDHRGVRGELSGACRLVDGGEGASTVDLRHASARLAGEHETAHLVAGLAGEVGIAALEAVHHAGRNQCLDGPIDRDRRQALAARGEPVEDLVGADRLVRCSNLAEHGLAQRRELQAAATE